MRISVRAKPNSYEEKVVPPSSAKADFGEAKQNFYTVYVKEPPVKGLANKAILHALREYFHTPNVRIVSGHTSRQKVVEIL